MFISVTCDGKMQDISSTYTEVGGRLWDAQELGRPGRTSFRNWR